MRENIKLPLVLFLFEKRGGQLSNKALAKVGGVVTEWLWSYKLQTTRFFKKSNSLLSETKPLPYNRVIRYSYKLAE